MHMAKFSYSMAYKTKMAKTENINQKNKIGCTAVGDSFKDILRILFEPPHEKTNKMLRRKQSTVQPHYNAPHYSAVFNITRPCHGSQINYFVIYLL